MRMLSLALATWLGVAAPAFAQDEPADEAIIRELMAVTESARMLDGVYAHIDTMMTQSIREALSGKSVKPEQQAPLDEMRESMSWESLEPMFIDIYRKSLTQSEVRGMLDFYRTDAGRVVIAKMPLVMQEQLRVMIPRIQEVQKDFVVRVRALNTPAAPTT